MNVLAAIENHKKSQPNKIAVVTPNRTYTYIKLFEEMCKTVSILGLTEKNECRIGILSSKNEYLIELILSSVASGNIAVPLDSKWRNDQLFRMLQLLQLDMLIIDSYLYGDWMNSLVSRIILTEEMEHQQTIKQSFVIQTVHTNTPFYLSFTSGTTGMPKAFIRDHNSWVQSLKRGQKAFRLSTNNQVGIAGPLAHSLNLFALFQTLFTGGTAHIRQNLSTHQWCQWVKDDGLPHLYVVPTMVNTLVNSLKDSNSEGSLTSVIVSGDRLRQSERNRFASRFPNVGLYEFYGASELSFVSYLKPDDAINYPSSSGQLFPGVSVMIDDQDEAGVGRIYIKSDMTFNGYIAQPEANSETFHGEYVTTGGIGYLKGNHLYVLGREKNMFITGGWNVYPEAVERILANFTGIGSFAVVGKPSLVWGKIPVLVLEKESNKTVDKKMLRRFSRANLSRHEVPRSVHIIETLPRTSSGKLARSELEAMIAEQGKLIDD